MSMQDDDGVPQKAFVTLSDGDGMGSVSVLPSWLVYAFVETVEEMVDADQEPAPLAETTVWIELDVIDAQLVQHYAYEAEWDPIDPNTATREQIADRKALLGSFLDHTDENKTIYINYHSYLDATAEERQVFLGGDWHLITLKNILSSEADLGQGSDEFAYDPVGRNIFLARDAYTDQAVEVIDFGFHAPDPRCLAFLREVISLNHIADDIDPGDGDGGAVPPIPVPSGPPPIVTFPSKNLFVMAYDFSAAPAYDSAGENAGMWDGQIYNSADAPIWVIDVGDQRLTTAPEDNHTNWRTPDGQAYTLFVFEDQRVIFANSAFTMASPPSPYKDSPDLAMPAPIGILAY
jgi:hypothetical protein